MIPKKVEKRRERKQPLLQNSSLAAGTRKKVAVLIVGGAGYIGSHMVKLLEASGYLPLVLDNLSSGSKASVEGVPFFKGDAGDKKLIKNIFSKHRFAAVIHFAAFIQVGESIKDPLKYYLNNVVSSIHLFETMAELGVTQLIFSSSAAVYGEPATEATIGETQPKLPINPYGQTKLTVETILADCCKTNANWTATCLRYFNVAGADPEIKASDCQALPTNLIPILLDKAGRDETFTIFGNDYKTADGTCIRDYIHVKDLCAAHLKVLKLMEASILTGYLALNLGTSKGYSVQEVIQTVECVTGKKIPIRIGPRRSGDPAMLVADGSLARKELDWVPRHSELKTIIYDAWQYEQKLRQVLQAKTTEKEEKAPLALSLPLTKIGLA